MLYGLRGGDHFRIKRHRSFGFFDNSFRLFDQTFNRIACLAGRLFANRLEDFLERFDLLLGFLQVISRSPSLEPCSTLP